MKLVLVGIICVAVILGSEPCVCAGAAYEWEQFHDGYEEEHEPEIGESAKDSGYGKRVSSHIQLQGAGAGVAKKEETSTLRQREPSVGREGGSTQSSNVGRKNNGIQKTGRKFQRHRDDRFTDEGQEADKLHGGYDHRAGRQGKPAPIQ